MANSNSTIQHIIKNDFETVLKSYPAERLTDIITSALASETVNPQFADYTAERRTDTVRIMTALQNLCLVAQDVEIVTIQK